MPITRRSLLLSAGATLAAAAAPPLPELRCPLASEPTCLIPGISQDPAALLLGSKLYRGLYRRGPDNTPQPDLVAAATVDGATATLHLLSGATWHDGGAVTAEDVVFSIERFHRRLQPARDWSWLKQIRATGVETVELTLSAPDPNLPARLDALSLPIVPQHIHDTLGFSIDAPLQHPIGCGPFRLAEWLKLVPFPWYAGPKPPWIALTCPILPTAATRTALATGGTPILLVDRAVELPALPRLRTLPGLTVTQEAPATSLLAGVRLNPAVPELGRDDARYALLRALDPAAAVRQAWFGTAQPAPGPGFDLYAASAGLSLAGLRPGDDGIRLRLTHLATPDAPWPQLAELVRTAWGQVGLDVTIAIVAPDELARRVAAGDYQSAGFAAETPPDGALPLVAPGIPIVHDSRLRWTGSVFGSFAGATFG